MLKIKNIIVSTLIVAGFSACSESTPSNTGDTPSVEHSTINHAPSINALSQQILTSPVNTSFTFEIEASDIDNDPVDYHWSIIQTPDRLGGYLSPGYTSAEFVGINAGEYVIGVYVDDGELESEHLEFSITYTSNNPVVFGSSGFDYGFASTFDQDGNIYVVGLSSGDIGDVVGLGGEDAFVAKFSNDLNLTWVKIFGSSDDDLATSVAIDKDGYIYVGGSSEGGVQDGITLNGNPHFTNFIAKYDNNGTQLWLEQNISLEVRDGAPSNLNALSDMVVDSNSNVYMIGTTDFYAPSSAGFADPKDAFLVKLNKDGQEIFTKFYGSDEPNDGRSISIDQNDNIYLALNTRRTSVSNGDGTFSNHYSDIQIKKINTSGDEIWSKTFGSLADDYVNSIYISQENHLYFTGNTEGKFVEAVSGDSYSLKGNSDIITAEINASTGEYIWVDQFGSMGAISNAMSLKSTASNSLLIAGYSNGDQGLATALGNDDIFSTSYTINGDFAYTGFKELYGTSDANRAYDLIILNKGNTQGMYLIGGTIGGLEQKSGLGGSDIFIYQP